MRAAVAVAVFASSALAFGPGGGFGGPGGWPGWPNCASDCSSQSNWGGNDPASWCKDTSNVTKANSCIAASSCSNDDKNAVYAAIATLCANNGVTLTISPEATFSATSGGPWPLTTNSQGGVGISDGPFGPDGWGPSAWSSATSWHSGAWTSWWNGTACPAATWSGWTAGPWSTDAPWTSWKACEASTTATSVITTNVSGTPTTSTSFGVQVAQASNTATGDSSSSATRSATRSTSSGAAAPLRTVPPAAVAAAAAVIGIVGQL